MSNSLPTAKNIRALVGDNKLTEAIALVIEIDEKSGLLFQRELKELQKKRIEGTENVNHKINDLSSRIIDFTQTIEAAEKEIQQELKTLPTKKNSQENNSKITDPFILKMEATLLNMKTEISQYIVKAAQKNKTVTYLFLEHKLQCLENYQKTLKDIEQKKAPNRTLVSQSINQLSDALEELKNILLASKLSASPLYQKTLSSSKQVDQLKSRILDYLIKPKKGLNTSDFSLVNLNLNQLNLQLKEKMENAGKYS